MGTYTDLYIADFPVHTTKSKVDSRVMSIFREADKTIQECTQSARNNLTCPGTSNSDEKEIFVKYSATVDQVIDRLNIMGFSLEASKAWYEHGILENLELYTELEKDDDFDFIKAKIELLNTFTFDKYTDAIAYIYEHRIERWMSSEELPIDIDPIIKFVYDDVDHEMYFGYPSYDIRHFLRIFCEVVPKSDFVVQDITDLVQGGYYNREDQICENAINELIGNYAIDSKVLILTEGSTDKNILEPTLKLLYPHLSDYFSFMDFGVSNAAGGASALVTTIKAFIAAGIGNRVIALFDNDTAAKVALKSLREIEIPKNINIMQYPDIGICNDYPTIGPTGLFEFNINGLAGSIEVYLGRDVLETDGVLTPVQWKGYDKSIRQYQGEIMDKTAIQNKFRAKLSTCQNDSSKISNHDWDELKVILNSIFTSFEDLMPNEVLSEE